MILVENRTIRHSGWLFQSRYRTKQFLTLSIEANFGGNSFFSQNKSDYNLNKFIQRDKMESKSIV